MVPAAAPAIPKNLRREVLFRDDSLLHSNRSGFCPVADLQLLIDAINMVANRVPADSEGPANFLVGKSFREHFQDFQLPRTQAGAMSPVGKHAGNSWNCQ